MKFYIIDNNYFTKLKAINNSNNGKNIYRLYIKKIIINLIKTSNFK